MTGHSYPFIDPVMFRVGPWEALGYQVGPLEIRWYGFMYLVGFACAYFVIRSELRRREGPIPAEAADDLLFYLILGLLIGARLGYAVFYNLENYISAPWEIFFVWHGGMSFHGGLAGMVVSGYVFALKHHAPFLQLADIGALASPIGLMFGRIGNFINGELFGRVTTLPWGIVFPTGGDLPRHPSQLYEALLEGPVLFGILWWLRRKTRHDGQVLGAFLVLYGVFRFCVEFVREPDVQLGFVAFGLTMGQILCILMVAAGLALLALIAAQGPRASRSGKD